LRVHWVPFVSLFSQARGLRRQSSSWCARLSRAQTTLPHPTLHEGLGVSLGSPFPTSHSPSHPSRSLPCSTWKTQTECCRWRVCLLAPSALCGSPVFAQRVRQVDLCDEGHTSQTGWPPSVLSPLAYDFRLDWLTSQTRSVRVSVKPEGFTTLQVIHHGIPQPSHHLLGACLSLMGPFRSMPLTP
jgi:hypothetical protein